MADWNSIPYELVCSIANKLSGIEDYTALTAVCRSYRSATKGEKWHPVEVSQAPWLLLSCQDEDVGSGGENPLQPERRRLMSVYRNWKQFTMNLPELIGRRCWGTPHGWIITLSLDRKMQLFNPLTRRSIALPDGISADTVPDNVSVRRYYIERAILLKKSPFSRSDNKEEDFIVVTLNGIGSFRLKRHGAWEELNQLPSPVKYAVRDIACYKGQIYALCNRGKLLICSNFHDGPDPPTVEEFVPPHDELLEDLDHETIYILESLGELLLLGRHKDYEPEHPPYPTLCFEAFRLDFEAKKWVDIEQDLGGCALFLGTSGSISMPRPEDFNCRPNCIYYTDDNYDLAKEFIGQDMGIYDVKEDTIESLYQEFDNYNGFHTGFMLFTSICVILCFYWIFLHYIMFIFLQSSCTNVHHSLIHI